MFTETIYITCDGDGCIGIWDKTPNVYKDDRWMNAKDDDESYGLMSDHEMPSSIKEKYGFIPEIGKRYEVVTELYCAVEEI
jgi:hypothetical protein